MPVVLKGCKKCGGDIHQQTLIGSEIERVCIQCGWRGYPTRAVRARVAPRRDIELWTDEDAAAAADLPAAV